MFTHQVHPNTTGRESIGLPMGRTPSRFRCKHQTQFEHPFTANHESWLHSIDTAILVIMTKHSRPSSSPPPSPPPFSDQLPSVNLLVDLVECLHKEWMGECAELVRLLQSPHVSCLMYVCDRIAKNNYDLEHFDSALATMERTGHRQTTKQVPHDNLVMARRRKRIHVQKLVNVIKSHEPLGVTVRLDHATGDVVLSRILIGGPAYRSGLVSVGDRILEVNGIRLRGLSHLDVIQVLQRECMKSVISFRVIASKVNPLGSDDLGVGGGVKSTIVKAHFDYNPLSDDKIPCIQIGLAFAKGAILNILNKDDANWWQACKELEISTKRRMEIFQVAGLIPSKQLQEQRIVAIRNALNSLNGLRYINLLGGLIPTPFKKAQWTVQKIKKIMYDLNDCIHYDREEIHTYEPVTKYLPAPNRYRPIILVGPAGVGRATLLQLIINTDPSKYREPLAHTSRYKRYAESDGIDYHFASEEWMKREIQADNFVCHSTHRGNLYGLHRTAIKRIMDSGHVALFKMSAQFLRLIHNEEFKPFVVFITPPHNITTLVNSRLHSGHHKRKSRSRLEYEMHLMIYEAHKLQFLYGHKFDATVVNDDLRVAYKNLIHVVRSVEVEPKWVPNTWVHKHV